MRCCSAILAIAEKLNSLNFFALGNLTEHLAILNASSKQNCDQCRMLWAQVCLHALPIPMKNTWVSLVCMMPFYQVILHVSSFNLFFRI